MATKTERVPIIEYYPRIEIPYINKLSLSFKEGVAKISFEAKIDPEILKLVYLQATAQPLNIVIESPQAEMDLKITVVNLKTGEVIE